LAIHRLSRVNLAHKETYDKARILHRDISVGNILITGDGSGYNIEDDDLSFLTLSAIPIQKLTVEHMYLYPKPGQFLASLVPSLTHLVISIQ